MKSIKVKMLAALAVSGLAGAGFLISTPAFAGTNGQTVRVCMQNVSYTNVTLKGTNEHGQEINTGALSFSAGCPTIENHKWKGVLSITMADSTVATEPPFTQTCNVPDSQPEDFFKCDMKLPDVKPPAPASVLTVIKFKSSGLYLAQGCVEDIIFGTEDASCTPDITINSDQSLEFRAEPKTPYLVVGLVTGAKGSNDPRLVGNTDQTLCYKFTGTLFNAKFREADCDDF